MDRFRMRLYLYCLAYVDLLYPVWNRSPGFGDRRA
jgi:hypothetical protein